MSSYYRKIILAAFSRFIVLWSYRKLDTAICDTVVGPRENHAMWNSQAEKVNHHMISLICGLENWEQLMNKQKNKQELITQTTAWGLLEGSRLGEWCRVKRVKHMVVQHDLTLGGGHTMQCTDPVSQRCTLETCTVLLANVTPIHLIKK